MTEAYSQGARWGGQYGPEAILGATGIPFALSSVTVYDSDGTTLASLFTDHTASSAAANPVTTDGFGNLIFWAYPGLYTLSFTIGSTTTTYQVTVNPWYADGVWNVSEDSAASYSVLSGDCRLANCATSSTNIAYTLPTPVSGGRVKIVRLDSTSYTVTVNSAGGATFIGPNWSASSFSLSPTCSVEFYADGAYWRVTGEAMGLVIESYIGGSVAVNASAVNLTSVALTPGTWLITGSALLYWGGSTSVATPVDVWLGPNSASASGAYKATTTTIGNAAGALQVGAVEITRPITLTSATTVYLEAKAQAAEGTTALQDALVTSAPNVTGISATRIA
jgi:hypothetical protein